MSRPGKTGGRLADVSHFFLSRVEASEDASPGTAEATPAPRFRENMRDTLWISSVVAGVPSAFLTSNLAVAMARKRPPVRIVDLETGPLTVPIAFGISPAYSALFRAYVEEGSVTASTATGPEGIEIISTLPENAGPLARDEEHSVLVNLASDQDVAIPDGSAVVFASVDPAGLLAAYEWLKVIAEGAGKARLGAVFLAPDAGSAKEAFERLSSACHRFLGRSFAHFGFFPSESFLSIHHSLAAGCPIVFLSPESAAAASFSDIAVRIAEPPASEESSSTEAAVTEISHTSAHAGTGRDAKTRSRPRVDLI